MLEWAARLRRRETDDTRTLHPGVVRAYRDNLAPVYLFIYRKVGNRETAEDLTSDVFAKAIRWLSADHSPQAVQAWLYATARTTIVDHWRGQIGDTVDIAELELLLHDSNAERGDEQRAIQQVDRLLAALPERERTVLQLRFLRGYSLAETAREVGTTEGNVKVLQHRALKRAAQLGRGEHERG